VQVSWSITIVQSSILFNQIKWFLFQSALNCGNWCVRAHLTTDVLGVKRPFEREFDSLTPRPRFCNYRKDVQRKFDKKNLTSEGKLKKICTSFTDSVVFLIADWNSKCFIKSVISLCNSSNCLFFSPSRASNLFSSPATLTCQSP